MNSYEKKACAEAGNGWIAFSALIAATLFLSLPLVVMGMPESVRIPIVSEHGEDDPAEAALFSHGAHDQYRCYVCHDGIFPQGKLGFTHDDMDNGKFCGACHDGKISWAVDDEDIECESCHVE